MTKLLILTQAVDREDPVLGFFHRWIEEFARHYEQVTIICLRKGDYELPSHVKVLSLGKEEGKGRLTYLLRFYRFIWQERKNYDAVFVHMNQEYVLLGGLPWRFLGKRVYLWRNHAKGNILTRLAIILSRKVFCTSPQSFTARFLKTHIMPAGVDTDFFKPSESVIRKPNSILFLGRIAPVKRVLEFVEWFNGLGEEFTATIAGAALPADEVYEAEVRRIASPRIRFVGAVGAEQARDLYRTHEVYVNKTPAGSFDKTIVEAAACGARVVTDNPAAHMIKPEEHNLVLLISRLAEEINT